MSDNNQAPGNIVTEVTSTASDSRNMRVTTDGDGGFKAEYLYTDANAVNNTADVSFPSAEHFTQEIAGHQQAIAGLQARLDAKVHDRAGRATGYEVSDERERALLQRQIDQRETSMSFTVQRLAQCHAATEAKLAARAAATERGEPAAAEPNSLHEQARREALISEAADMIVNGRPMGRAEASKAVDAELARERIAALVRSRR